MRVALVFVVAACGGGGSDNPPAVDAKIFLDAPPPNCLVMANYGDLGTKMGTTSLGPTAAIVLDANPPRDSFFLKLVAGKGVFAGGLANGTYTLAGAELMQGNCGV